MISVNLMNTPDPNNKITKAVSSVGVMSADMKENTSIMDPVLLVDTTAIQFEHNKTLFDANYAYIPEFRRYYHITDIKTVTNVIFEISLHVDVLRSFASGILSSPCVVEKNENDFNLYLNDTQYKCKQRKLILINNFPSGFNTQFARFVTTIFGDKVNP